MIISPPVVIVFCFTFCFFFTTAGAERKGKSLLSSFPSISMAMGNMETMRPLRILRTAGTRDKVTVGLMTWTPCHLMRFQLGRRKRTERKGPVITVIMETCPSQDI